MCKACRLNTMEWANLVTFHGFENRSGWRPGKPWMASHPQLRRAILWNKSYCWLLCNLPRTAHSIMPAAAADCYCSASFHFSLEQKSDAFLQLTQSVLGKQSSSCGLPEPRVCGPWLGRRGGMRAAKKCSPEKNLNCSLACGCAGEKYVSQKDYKERFPE